MRTEIFSFVPEEWFTPHTYDANYKDLIEASAIYLITYGVVKKRSIKHIILYVGSSRNLKKRFKSHSVYREVSEAYPLVQMFFKPIENSIRLATEKQLIQTIKPKYNSQWLNG